MYIYKINWNVFLNLLRKDFSTKPWNKLSNFKNFIAPKNNVSLLLKYHRFNLVLILFYIFLLTIDLNIFSQNVSIQIVKLVLSSKMS